MYNIINISELTDTNPFIFDNLSLTTPILLQDETYFTKIKYNKKPLYIETSKSLTKNGFVKNDKKYHCDLMFDYKSKKTIQWAELLEEKCQQLILSKSEKWFQNSLNINDIESSFNSIIRTYKCGKFHIIRTNIKKNQYNLPFAKIYDENENILNYEDLNNTHEIISILEIQGIKFTSTNFQLEIELKQIMVIKIDLQFEKCMLKYNNNIADDITTDDDIDTISNEVTDDISDDISDDIIADDITTNDITTNDIIADDIIADDITTNDITTNDITTNDITTNDIIADDITTNDIIADDITIDDITIDDNTPDDNTPDDNTPDGNTPDGNTPNDNTPDDITPDYITTNNDQLQLIDLDDLTNLNDDDMLLSSDQSNSLETTDILLKTPDEVHIKLYNDACQKALNAKNDAIIAFLNAKHIKDTYLINTETENKIENYDDNISQLQELNINSSVYLE
jgi:hypothetical protein